jgi:hypothetical protein
MPRYQFNKPARAALLDELLAAGLPPLRVEMDGIYQPDGSIVGDSTCWVTASLEQANAVAAVVAAHNAASVDAAVSTARTRQQQARQTLVTYLGNATPTAAETTAAVKALAFAVRDLYRAT